MSHAALWVVQQIKKKEVSFFASFQCRTRLCGWCNPTDFTFQITDGRFQCRTRLCGWCNSDSHCPRMCRLGRFNAARGFVGGATLDAPEMLVCEFGFNAARGFVGGATKTMKSLLPAASSFQCRTRLCGWCNYFTLFTSCYPYEFQCRTRLCGWCNTLNWKRWCSVFEFQCRTRLCGWCNVLCTVYIIAETTPNDKCFPMQ